MVLLLFICYILVQQKHFKSMQILCLNHTYPPRLTKLAVLMWYGMCICQTVSKGQPDKREERVVRRRVSLSTTIPKSWKDFLRVDDNKTELFKFLAQHVTCRTVDEGKVLYATSAQNVLSSTCQAELSNLTPCSQEEADTRLILHAAYAVAQSKRRVSVRSVDTDVVVLAATFFSQMKPDEMWIAFSTRKNFVLYPFMKLFLL